jgi:small subunit ribosomal protein S1
MEENPWDVYETMFTVGSEQEGTIININEKGAIVMLDYGVEAFAPKKELTKEDGSLGKVEEKMVFVVADFNKSAKKIILAQPKVVEEESEEQTGDESKKAKSSKKVQKRTKISLEKTTLGDISDLAELKQKLEDEEKNSEEDEEE